MLGVTARKMKTLTVQMERATVSGKGRQNVTCGMAVRRVGMLGVTVRKITSLTVEMEIVTPIGTGRQNVTCCMY